MAGASARDQKYLFRRFPFTVIYRVTETTIQIIAVAHGRRRPSYWRTRGTSTTSSRMKHGDEVYPE